MKIKKSDILLIGLLLIAAIGLGCYLKMTQTEGAKVQVKINNEIVGIYSLSEDTTVNFGDEKNYNILVIENNTARVSEASCPDQLCVHQKEISYDSQSIICLPNKVVVEVISDENPDADVVVN